MSEKLKEETEEIIEAEAESETPDGTDGEETEENKEGNSEENKEENAEEKPEKEESLKDDILWFLKVLLISAAIALCIRFCTPIIFVSGPSMNKTLYDKELCIGWAFGNPEHEDIVVFHGTDYAGNEEVLIKRVIGVPGDTIRYDGDNIYRNGELLEEDYIYLAPEYSFNGAGEVTLEDGEYFVCGDNRHNSYDSRYFGKVKEEQIFAKIVVRIDLRPIKNLFVKDSAETD